MIVNEAPITNIFKIGSKLSPDCQRRRIETCERAWNKDFRVRVGSLDQLVARQARIALALGENQVNIVDIGSGDGVLIEEFVNTVTSFPKPPSLRQTTDLLRQNPRLKIGITGLTDATSPENFLRVREIKPSWDQPNPLPGQIEARNVQYSLTFDQTLKKFLERMGIPRVNLFLSTSCLTYLHPRLFQAVLTDSVEVLTAGGQIVASEYASVTGEHLSPPQIDPTNKASGFWKQVQDLAIEAIADEKERAEKTARLRLLLSSKHRLPSLPIITTEYANNPEQIKALKHWLDYDLSGITTSHYQLKHRLMVEKKRRILRDLKHQNATDFQVNFGRNVISIKTPFSPVEKTKQYLEGLVRGLIFTNN